MPMAVIPRWRGATTTACSSPRDARGDAAADRRPRTAGGSLDEAFGSSVVLYRRGATTVVGHTGEQSGFRSFVYFDPRTTVAVIGVLNTTNEARPDESNRGWDVLTHQAVALVAP